MDAVLLKDRSIRAESELGHGSTFLFTLPAA
jgi:signal transduction histidine kinase